MVVNYIGRESQPFRLYRETGDRYLVQRREPLGQRTNQRFTESGSLRTALLFDRSYLFEFVVVVPTGMGF